MQWALLTVETWYNEVGLSVNPDKTEKKETPGFLWTTFRWGVTLSL